MSNWLESTMYKHYEGRCPIPFWDSRLEYWENRENVDQYLAEHGGFYIDLYNLEIAEFSWRAV